MEQVVQDLVAHVDTLTNTLLALEQRVAFLEDQQKENLEPTGISRMSGNSVNLSS